MDRETLSMIIKRVTLDLEETKKRHIEEIRKKELHLLMLHKYYDSIEKIYVTRSKL